MNRNENGITIFPLNPDDVHKTMRPVKVTFSDGSTIETCINGSKNVIRAYYLNNYFNVASYPEEKLCKGIKVQFLDEETENQEEYSINIEDEKEIEQPEANGRCILCDGLYQPHNENDTICPDCQDEIDSKDPEDVLKDLFK